MREEIRRILEMNKTGKLSDDQATELLAAINEPKESTDEPTAPLGEDRVRDIFDGRSILSKVEQVEGSEFTFNDNSINVSSVTKIRMRKSQMCDNSINASKISGFDLIESEFNDCAVNGSALEDFEIKHGHLTDVSFHGSKVSRVSLIDQCAIEDVSFQGCAIKNLSVKSQSRIQDAKFAGFQGAEVELVNSSIEDFKIEAGSLHGLKMKNSHWQDVVCQAIRFENVEFIDSTLRDCSVVGRDKRNSVGFENVKFQNSSFQDVKFENCHFKNVTFVGLHARNLKLKDLKLRDRVIRSVNELTTTSP